MNRATEQLLKDATEVNRNPALKAFLIASLAPSVGASVIRLCRDWAEDGFQVVRLDSIMTALDLAETDPPATQSHLHQATLAIEIEGNTILVRPPVEWGPPGEMEIVAMYDSHGYCEEQLKRLYANIHFALAVKPEGLSVIKHVPSPKAARKRGRKYFPGVEFIIGATRPLRKNFTNGVPVGPIQRPSDQVPVNDEVSATISAREGRAWSVKTVTRGHWRHQAHGPNWSLHRLIWIPPHWTGPEDAPISVHVTRLNTVGHAA